MQHRKEAFVYPQCAYFFPGKYIRCIVDIFFGLSQRQSGNRLYKLFFVRLYIDCCGHKNAAPDKEGKGRAVW